MPGETLPFRTRLASPPRDGQEVLVRFFNRRDLAAGEGRMARILIAEDEAGLRSLVARALALDGHDVVTAKDGAAALDLLTRTQGAFELLLTDIRMPVMDGIA